MIKYKPKMFIESEKSRCPKNIFLQILIFLVVFILALLAEQLIPSIVSASELMERMYEEGLFYTEENIFARLMSVNYKRIQKLTLEVMMQPKFFIIMIYNTGFGTILTIIYCKFIEKRSFGSMGFRLSKIGRNYLTGMLVGFVCISFICLMPAAFGIVNVEVCKDTSLLMIIIYLGGFFLQGMSEEVIFRGYLMSTVGGKHSTTAAIMISSAAFSLAHAANPGYSFFVFINLFLFAAFAGLYIIYTDNIWGASAIHTVWNFCQGNIYGVSVSGSGDQISVLRTTAASENKFLTGGDFGLEGSIFTTIAMAAAITVMCLLIKRKCSDEKKV